MRNRTKLILIGIILVIAFFFTACKNIFPPAIFGKTEKKGNVTVSFSGLSGRNLWPSALDFDLYEFTFTNGGYEETFDEPKSPSGSFTFTVDEGPGYSLNVKAYKVIDSTRIPVAEGNTEELFTVSDSTTVTIKLTGNSSLEDDGIFSFSVQYPAGATIDRLVLIDGDGIDEDVLSGAVTTNVGLVEIISNSIDVPAGWYGLEMDIIYGNQIAYYDDIVSIFSYTTTFYGTANTPIIFEETDFFELQYETVTVSGEYELILNSGLDQTSVIVEVYTNPAAKLPVNSIQAVIETNGNNGDGTWELEIPKDKPVWFRVSVTDETGYTFGRIVSASGSVFDDDADNVALTLGPFAAPELTAFTLLNASAQSGSKNDKTAAINQSNGEITFIKTSFRTISVNTIIDFHKLAADFTIAQDNKLYVGSVEQINGVTTNNYYQPVMLTVVSADNVRKTYTIAGQVLDVDSSADGSDNLTAVNRVVGTSSWQTQGFGVLNVTTTDTSLGLPGRWTNKLNLVWNPTGTFTYIGPTGRVISGGTDIKGRGNWTFRGGQTYKSYNLKLNTAAGFDWYNYKTKEYETLPAHKRWGVMSNEGDPTRIKNTLAWEMGRGVLTHMGWQPHADWVFFFLNGEYKGLYLLGEIIKPEQERLNVAPVASSGNLDGGFIVEMNNLYFYYDESWDNHRKEGDNTLAPGSYTFDELYNFMTSHQNPVSNDEGPRQQGVLWSFKEPDSDLGWYYNDPPEGNGNLTFTDSAHAQYFPRKGIVLMARRNDGGALGSKTVEQWTVPDEIGQPNGMGAMHSELGVSGRNRPAMLPFGNYGMNNGGVFGDRTLSEIYMDYESSAFVRAAQTIQIAEDAVYSHDWLDNGYGNGSYLDHIDINSFIDWQIAHEMLSDNELNMLNGHFMHYDPVQRKLKMGPIWDMDNMWRDDPSAPVGNVAKTSFWYKEFIGYEVTGTTGLGPQPTVVVETGIKEPYYIDQLQSRWGEVSGQLTSELYLYIDAMDCRFSRVTGYDHTLAVNGDRNGIKGYISTRIGQLDGVFGGY